MEMEIEKLKLEKRKVRVKRDTLISLFILLCFWGLEECTRTQDGESTARLYC